MRPPLLLGSSCLIPASPLICMGRFLCERLLRTQHFPDFPMDVLLAAQWPLLSQLSATTPAPRGQTPTWHCSPCRAPREEEEEEGDAHSSSVLKRLLSTSARAQQHRAASTGQKEHGREGTDSCGAGLERPARPHSTHTAPATFPPGAGAAWEPAPLSAQHKPAPSPPAPAAMETGRFPPRIPSLLERSLLIKGT